MYSLNAASTVTVTNDTNGIKLKLLGKLLEEFQLNEKPICMQVLKGHISTIGHIRT